jgi:uncharacterized protein YqgQ
VRHVWPNAKELVKNLNLALHGKKFADPRLSKIFMAEAMHLKLDEVDNMDEEDFLLAQWVIRRRNRINKQRK